MTACCKLLVSAWMKGADFTTFDILPSISDVRELQVGQELIAEKLPLQGGQCVHVLDGLELSESYEVKISYPGLLASSSHDGKIFFTAPIQYRKQLR
ncbi:hypothetical protein KP509_34G000400 [Ceratopteris richardii]|uniref:Uncharacterized protein n=1 Tax=Ceratopteris richardii TaxID=49495 RepID=A0A8T2QHE8_CERRI|nr:hypothetical protein KP509_34G000400 [Ceratopteris richardii]